MFDASLEEHLMADTDSEGRPIGRQARGDDLWATDGYQPCHARGEGTDAGNNQAIGRCREPRVSGHRDFRTGTRDRPFG